MKVYSGKCYKGECGTPTAMTDVMGKPLRVGDIVLSFHEYHPSKEGFPPTACDHLTVVVDGRFVSYSDGSIESVDGSCFVMGLKGVCEDCVPDSDKWSVMLLKPWEDVVDGEHWAAFGFNYKEAAE